MFQKASKSLMCGILVTAFVLPLAACDNGDKAEEKAAPQAASQPGSPPATAENSSAQLASKLNDYIGCYNTADGSARGSAQRYVGWLSDPDKGPTGKERNVDVLGDVTAYELKTCTTGINQASGAKPTLPALDKAAKQYLTELTALAPLVSEAHTYYSQENYKDDGFAKGKEMHPPLMAAFGRFIKASDAFGDELENESNALNAAQLIEIEKSEGRHIAYYRLALMSQAKLLAMQVSAESPDIAVVAKAIDAYSALVEESAKATANEPGKPIGWSTFQSSAETFLKDCKDRMRRVRDKTPYSSGEQMLMKDSATSGWMVAGSPMKIMKSYNNLVDAGNRL